MEKEPFEAREERTNETGHERVQRFQFGPWTFNIDRAQAIVAESPREPKPLPVAPWVRFYGLDNSEGPGLSLFTPLPSFNPKYAMTTDLNEPVLVATVRSEGSEEFSLLIDGTHRLYRAFAEQIGTLPAYVLSVEESLTIREDGLIGSRLYWPGYDRGRPPGGAAEPESGDDR